MGEPIARRGLEGRPDDLDRMDAGVKGSLLRSDMYGGGPSNGVKNRSLPLLITNKSWGREMGESDRRFNGNEQIRHADVRTKMPYAKYTSFGTATATTGFEHLSSTS